MRVNSFTPNTALVQRPAVSAPKERLTQQSVAGDTFEASKATAIPEQNLPLPSNGIHDEVISLTQALVRVNSGPDNLVPGENAVADIVEGFANDNGLEVERYETVRGRPMVVVTLPGTNPELGSVGFVHHSDVVSIEGEWNLGEPFSGDITTDSHGREVLVGRGSIDTKGPAAQVLVAMKHLKSTGATVDGKDVNAAVRAMRS